MKRFSILIVAALMALPLAGCDLFGAAGLDSMPPTVLVTRPGEGAIVAGQRVRFYIRTEPGFGKTISTVSVSIDGNDAGTAWPTGTENLWGFDWDATAATAGAHRVTVTATDNISSRGYAEALNVTVVEHDPAAPSARVQDPQDGAEVFDNVLITADTDPGVTAVGFLINGAREFLDDVAPFEFMWNASNEVVAPNTIQLIAYDADGTASVGPVTNVTVLFDTDGAGGDTPSEEPGKVFFSTTLQGQAQGSAALGFRGEVYIGTSAKKLYAFDRTGIAKWDVDLGGVVTTSPLVSNNENVFVTANDGKLYAYSRSGQSLWTPYSTGSTVVSSPAYGVDGTIYLGDGDGTLHAVNSFTGKKKWTRSVAGNAIVVPPVISRDGYIFTAGTDGSVYALDADGNTLWQANNVGVVFGGIALLETEVTNTLPNGATTTIDGTALYVVAQDKLVALSGANGDVMWSYELDGPVQSAPVVDADETIYVGTHTGLVALNANLSSSRPNRLRWVFPAENVGTAIIDANGTVYAVADTRLYARNSNNTPVWDLDLKGEVHGPLTMTREGRIVLMTAQNSNSFAKAINTGSDGLENAGWPMFQRNSRHTGRLGEDEND